MNETKTNAAQYCIADQDLTSEQVAEIDVQKYLMSEKAGYDVGWECAKQSWLEQQAIPEPTASAAENFTATDKPTQLPEMTESRLPHEETVLQKPKGIGSFFKRLLSKAASF